MVTPKRDLVINNIKNNVSEGKFNSKVEVDDPKLSEEEKRETLKFFLDGSLGNVEEKQKVLLSTMLQSNEDLLGLVNALLEVYRFESGKLNLCKTVFNISDLVSQCYEELEPLSKKKDISFNLHSEVDKDLLIDADRAEIKRVITNLCGNARL